LPGRSLCTPAAGSGPITIDRIPGISFPGAPAGRSFCDVCHLPAGCRRLHRAKQRDTDPRWK
jgi:hypothetical protein